MGVVYFQLIFNGLLNSIGRLLRMQVQKHLNAFMFVPIFHIINDEALYSSGHLLDFSKEALLPSFCH